MKFVLAFCLALVLLTSNAAVAADNAKESAYDRVLRTGTIRCGFATWPPYFSKDTVSGAVTGLDKDLSDAVFKVLGLKAEYIEIVLGEQIQDMRSGKIDAVCGDGPWIISTAKYLRYSTPAYIAPLGVYVLAGQTKLHGIKDLNSPNVKLTAIDGDLSLDLAQLRFPNARLSTLPSTADPSQMLTDIATGKADAGIMDALAAKKFNATNPKKVAPLPPMPFAVNKAGFSTLKEEGALMDTLDQGLDAARNAGLVDDVLDRYDPDRTLLLRPAKPYQPMK